jgi:SAM-dependent methyltransferase
MGPCPLQHFQRTQEGKPMTEALPKCTFCSSSNYRKAYPVTDIFGNTRDLHVCDDCNTRYLWPKPGEEDLKQAYDDSYYGTAETKFKWKAVENTIEYFRKQRARKMKRLLQTGAKVLDIGCGNGRYLMHLAGMGDYELHGTELAGGSAQRASAIKDIKLFIGRFEQAAYPDKYFDSISLYHVFEHLEEPVSALDEISRIIKEDGVLVLSFPNIRSFQSRLLKSAWLHLDPPRHLFFPDHKRFADMMQERGYTLIGKKFFSSEQNPVGMVQGLLNKMCKRRDVLFERMKGNKAYAREYGKLNIMLQKMFFLCAMPVCMFSDIFDSAFGAGATVEMSFRKDGNR